MTKLTEDQKLDPSCTTPAILQMLPISLFFIPHTKMAKVQVKLISALF